MQKRTYKNGITGKRYKGLYIIEGDKGHYQIWDEDKVVLWNDILDEKECEWVIDKNTESEEILNIIKDLYKREIFELTRIWADFMELSGEGKLTEKQKLVFQYLCKVRNRKIKNKPY